MPNDILNVNWPGWETVRLIGRGSFGAVYEIERKVFKETESAALKVISIPQNSSDIDELYNDGYDDESITSTFQSHLESIVAEYSLMRKMNGSVNIVNCEDVRYVQHDDGFGWDIFIKMELLTPLAKSLTDPVGDEAVIKIAKDMCAALELCKKHGVIHRDIKPQNIFVSPNGDYKLGDFGIAKVVEKTMGGTKIGTYKYMAPEVYNNQPYGASADIYSLGLVLYWLLNERRMPFLPPAPEKLKAGMEENARMRRLNGEQIPLPVHGSEQLKRIVLKACAFDVKERYHSATEMLHDLRGLSSPNESINEDECAVLKNSTSELPADEPPKMEDPKHVPSPHDDTLDMVSHADDQSTEQKKLTPYLVMLVAAWVGSVVASIWTLSNIKLYVPHIYDGSSPWIYISLITGWSIPLVAFMAAKYNKKTICGVNSKTICQIAAVAQLVVFALDFAFLILQEYLRFVPGALLLSETYWLPGYLQNEWMPFIVCLFAFILLIAKDCLALWISTKNNLQERKTSEADKNEIGVTGSNEQSKRFNKRNLLFKWFPLVAILLYLLFLLLNPVTLIKRMFVHDIPADSTPPEETSQTISENECNHDWISVEINEFELATFRHIPIIFSDATDDAKAEAHQKAQEIIAEWQSAGSTEDAFAQLHTKFSPDGTSDNGGLIEKARRMDIEDNLETWLFDEPREYGDFGLVETDTGYELIYYLSCGLYKIDSNEPAYCNYCYKPNGEYVALYATVIEKSIVKVIAGAYHNIALYSDGTVKASGVDYYGEGQVDDWTGIVDISATDYVSVGLKNDGTVVAVGNDTYGKYDTSSWKNIVSIASSSTNIIGVREDGTVVATGNNDYGQCNTESWTDITQAAIGTTHAVGLRADGTVIAIGDNEYGQCNVSEWTDIVSIKVAFLRTIGLKADGTVVATGGNFDGECDVSGWNNIVAIDTDGNHTVGLKSNGTVVAAGFNTWESHNACEVEAWSNVVYIDVGFYRTIGLKADGTILVVGWNDRGQCDIQGLETP